MRIKEAFVEGLIGVGLAYGSWIYYSPSDYIKSAIAAGIGAALVLDVFLTCGKSLFKIKKFPVFPKKDPYLIRAADYIYRNIKSG